MKNAAYRFSPRLRFDEWLLLQAISIAHIRSSSEFLHSVQVVDQVFLAVLKLIDGGQNLWDWWPDEYENDEVVALYLNMSANQQARLVKLSASGLEKAPHTLTFRATLKMYYGMHRDFVDRHMPIAYPFPANGVGTKYGITPELRAIFLQQKGDLTIPELAKRMAISHGLAQTFTRRKESNVAYRTLVRMSVYIGVSVDELIARCKLEPSQSLQADPKKVIEESAVEGSLPAKVARLEAEYRELEAKHHELEARHHELRMDNETLKKALFIFAKEH